MRLYVVVIPLLLLLELAVALERRVHEALFVLRHGCRPDDYRWFPGAHGPAEPLPFPSETAADAATQPRRPRRWLGWGLAALALAGCLLFVSPTEVAAALRRVSLAELAVLLLLAGRARLLRGWGGAVRRRLAGVRLPLARAVRLFYQASAVGTL